jgi:hypothetical protein
LPSFPPLEEEEEEEDEDEDDDGMPSMIQRPRSKVNDGSDDDNNDDAAGVCRVTPSSVMDKPGGTSISTMRPPPIIISFVGGRRSSGRSGWCVIDEC